MLTRKSSTTIFLFLLFVAIFFIKDRFTETLYQDEHHYLPTAVLFSTEPIPSVELLKSYNELNTPLPFILGGWVIRLFGENIQYLRLLTFGFSFLLLMVFVWSAPRRSDRFFLCLGGLMIFPSYYLCSIYYYTDIFAMATVLAGVAAYLRQKHAWAALFFIAAISSRQYMLAFPVAIIAYNWISGLRESGSIRAFISYLIVNPSWIFYGVSVLSIVPWVLLWEGPAPANVMAEQHYDSDKLVAYNFGYVLYASACLSVYYVIPEVLFTGKWKYFIDFPKKYTGLFVALLITVAAFVSVFPAKQAYNPYFTWPYLGYVDQLLMTIGISGVLKQCIFGLLMLIALMRFVIPNPKLMSYIFLFNILLLGKAQLSWDKYSLPMIMVLWFLAMFDEEWSLSKYKGSPVYKST